MRLVAAVLTLCAAICLAALLGPGRAWGGIVMLTGLFLLARRLGPRGRKRLLAGMMWLSVAVAALCIEQMFWMPRARGIFASPNFLGGYAVMMFFLALRAREKPDWHNIPLLANLVSVALSQSRGAFIALAAGLLVYNPLRRHHRIQLGAAALVAALVLAHYRPQEARIGIWRVGAVAAIQRPVLGWGPGGLEVGTLRHFYNIPLDLTISAGIVGLAAGIWLGVEAMRAARPHPAMRALLVAWLVNGLFIFATPATTVPLFLALAWLASEQRRVEDVAALIDDGQPLLHRRMRAYGAD